MAMTKEQFVAKGQAIKAGFDWAALFEAVGPFLAMLIQNLFKKKQEGVTFQATGEHDAAFESLKNCTPEECCDKLAELCFKLENK